MPNDSLQRKKRFQTLGRANGISVDLAFFTPIVYVESLSTKRKYTSLSQRLYSILDVHYFVQELYF